MPIKHDIVFINSRNQVVYNNSIFAGIDFAKVFGKLTRFAYDAEMSVQKLTETVRYISSEEEENEDTD